MGTAVEQQQSHCLSKTLSREAINNPLHVDRGDGVLNLLQVIVNFRCLFHHPWLCRNSFNIQTGSLKSNEMGKLFDFLVVKSKDEVMVSGGSSSSSITVIKVCILTLHFATQLKTFWMYELGTPSSSMHGNVRSFNCFLVSCSPSASMMMEPSGHASKG